MTLEEDSHFLTQIEHREKLGDWGKKWNGGEARYPLSPRLK
jgi:hypothetical protein